MTKPIPGAPPEDAWAGERVTRWLERSDALEKQMLPVSELLFAAAAIQPGEIVLDVGCGHGPTTREAAERAGADGSVTGLDVSAEMLAAAAEVEVPAGAAPIEWVVADAVTWDPPDGRFDLTMSRFGVMFFSDPPAAMANLATATRAGGRLCFAVWGPRTESPVFELPYQVALDVLRTRGDDVAELPPDGGPFSWHDTERVRALLEPAGWHDVALAPHVLPLRFGGGLSAADASGVFLDVGPARALLEGVDADTHEAARAAVEAATRDYLDDSGHVVIDGAIRIITARR